MKATRQLLSLCLVIGMTIAGNVSGLAQGNEYAHTASYVNRSTPASTNNEIRELTVGDKVPDFEFQNILNYKNKRAKLSDFKGKLVILDMWSTWCSTCIDAFPKMEALQKEFGSEIQILLVNPHNPKYDSEKRIASVLDKLKARTGFYPSLPIPIQDSVLNIYFPHKSVPHQVWIDGSGRVKAITSTRDVTEENIRAIVKGDNIKIPVKSDWGFDKEKPLLVDGNGGNADEFLFRSIFTKYKDGVGIKTGARLNENKDVIGIYFLNRTLKGLIGDAYADLVNGLSRNRIIYDVKKENLLKDEMSNRYCYDLTIPPTPWSQLDTKKYLKEDLKRYFNLSAHVERRMIKSLVVTSSDKLEKLYSRFEKPSFDLDATSILKYIHNYTVEDILKFLEGRLDAPLINETGLVNKIDIDFPERFSLTDRKGMIEYLVNLGFNVKEEERQLDVVVITDK